ncbi:epoxide hydrolase family protein [Halostreptopolyspora alba]|uniref:Epoxide hydrolase n=1 Tax=Halostreptopolyspora alba TaxID=2487137 RepID=A0A3N0EHM6_9ACTN|nr:epoxide hydrolase [Nocardiopsaceae bacterium YIM 96095]
MNDNTRIHPFRIEIPQDAIEDLHDRLARTRWPDSPPGVGWDYGVPSDYLRDLAEYWRTGYDWRATEARLNAFDQFTTEIDGQEIHFVHVRSPEPDAVPLLLTHGWPSTFAIFADVIGPLTDPRGHGAEHARAFHVVAPSVPGFAFSGPTREPGWSVERTARAWAELMRRLGYDRYIAQGGDFGSLVSPELGRNDREHVIGVHVNGLISASVLDYTSEDPTAGFTEEELATLYAQETQWEQRQGYAAVNSTRPQTIAYALTDSPVGLLAWNLEWFVDYDPTRTEQTPIDRDTILTQVSLFWFTATSGSAARIYKDCGDAFYGGENSGVPTAVALFPGDTPIRTLADRCNTVVRWQRYDRGGHFAAIQAPDLLTDDIREFAAELT